MRSKYITMLLYKVCICNCVYLKEEEIHSSLAYKLLSVQHTKKLMNIETVDELARSAIYHYFIHINFFSSLVRLFCIKNVPLLF